MEKGFVGVYCGYGKGKSAIAIGQAIQAVSQGKTVIVIQFLKGKDTAKLDFLERLEPEIKLFRFEKNEKYYEELTDEEKLEENQNIRNGLNFARKVLVTEECDVLILDEILGVVEHGIITVEDLRALLSARDKNTEVVLTGYSMPKELLEEVNVVTRLETVVHNHENEKMNH